MGERIDLSGIVLPSLPEVVTELVAMIGQEYVHGAQLSRVVSRDPALAGATLKLANSSFFGLAGRVASMQDAVTLIGVNGVRNMLLILGMRNTLRPAAGSFDTHAFWLHALETAAASRALVREHPSMGDEAFLAGLIHDLGKLLIACARPELLERIQSHAWREGCSYAEAECAIGDVNHEEAGLALAEAWRLPDHLSAVLRCHHAPDADAPMLAHAVHVANLIAHVAQGTTGEPGPRLQPSSWQRLSPAESDIERAVLAVRSLRQRSGEWRALLAQT